VRRLPPFPSGVFLATGLPGRDPRNGAIAALPSMAESSAAVKSALRERTGGNIPPCADERWQSAGCMSPGKLQNHMAEVKILGGGAVCRECRLGLSTQQRKTQLGRRVVFGCQLQGGREVDGIGRRHSIATRFLTLVEILICKVE
jgi:hypothetical protein